MATLNGKFIVLDGIDGCGKGTQTKLLSDFLIQKGLPVINKKYPEYGQPIGDLIHNWLYKSHELNVEAQTLLYFADFIKDKTLLEDCVKDGKIIISDRYFTTTLIYQYLNGLALEKILELAKLFNLRQPDLCFYIKISPETSLARKSKEKAGNLDRHEEDKQFQAKLAETFEKIIQEKIYCNWEVIDGEQTPENVHAQIVATLTKHFPL